MTPAIDIAKKSAIEFSVHQYKHDTATNSYGDEAAKALKLNPTRVFKTLLVETNTGELIVGLVPVSHKLDLKAIAAASKAKKATMANRTRVQSITGYVIGGVSPLGQRKRLSTIIDSSSKDFDTIFVSAGKRGLEIELRANDLAKLTQARFEKISIP